MSFPLNPVNGQTTVTNNISYVYNSAGTGYWTRIYANTSTLIGTQAALNIANTSQSISTTTGALIVGGGVGIGGNLYVGGTINGIINAVTATNFSVSAVSSNTPRYLTFVSTTTGYATAETTSTGLLYVANRGLAIGTSTITASADPMAFTGNFTSGKVLDIYGALYLRQVRVGAGAGINPANYLGQGVYDSTTYINAAGASNNFVWQINGGQKMFLSNAGYFGVGNPPISDLHLHGTQLRHNDITGWNTYTFTVSPGVVQLASTASFSIQTANVSITSTVSSTSTTTGALIVAGGAGIADNLYVGGKLRVVNPTNATTTTDGALVVTGGVGIGGDLYIAGKIVAQKLEIQLTTVTTTLLVTDDIINTYNTTAATSTTTGALVVAGGVGIGGTVYVGSLRGDVTTSATTWGLFYNVVTKEITTATGGGGSSASSGISSTGTTSTFTILSTANSFSTNTGALQVHGGAGIGKNLYVGGNLYVSGVSTASIIYDSGDTTNNTYWQGTGTSRIVGISARNPELFPGSDTPIGTISVTRSAITAANSATYYGLYNRVNSFATGIGVDVDNNLWFGRVTAGGSASTRQTNLFYSDSSGNVYAGNSFRSNVFYSAKNSAYFLDFTTTATKHTILSNAVSTDLIGYDPALGVYIGGTDNRYLTNGTTSSGGPLWVMTGTTYNLIHSGNIAQYSAGVSTTTYTTPVVIRLNTTDTTGTNTGTHLTLVNPNVGSPSSGIYWKFGNQSEIRASIRVNVDGDVIHNSLSGNYRFQQDFGTTGSNFVISATTFMSVDYAGNVSFPKNITAAKLVDYNDNTYFLDPNSTSTINQLTLKGLFTATVAGTSNTWTDVLLVTATAGGTYISARRPTVTTGDVGYKWMTGTSTIWTNYLPGSDTNTLTWGLNGVKQLTLNGSGNLSIQVAGGAMGATQFYDSNNSSYFTKPAGYSYLNSLNLGGLITGISTGTGIRVFNNGSNSFTSTVFWGAPTLNYFWNLQTDASGNAALWSSTSSRVLTVTPSGNWGFNQSSLPGDVDMIGGISVTGTGTTQMSAMKGSTSGFSLRVSDAIFGDFSLYDKAQGSWKLAINARRGSVGINTTATTTYGLNIGGDINIGGAIYQNGSPFTTNVSTTTFTANQYAWYGTTGTGFGSTLYHSFETAAIGGPDYVLGSGTLVDLLAWNFPTTTEYYNGVSATWVNDATDIKPLFNSQRSLIGTINNNYTFNAGLAKQAVRFTWTTFGIKSWDALVITGHTAGQVLDATLESSTNTGVTIVTHIFRTSLGSTGAQGRLYLRTQGVSVGTWFRLTIRESLPSVAALAVNLFNISLLGATGAGLRLLNWDNQRNITTYGNLTTNIVYDTNNSAYYLSPTKTSNLFTATLAGDLLAQGQGRFTGWQNAVNTATRTTGFGVEIGVVSGEGGISAYNRTLSAYGTLGIFGSPIRIIPQTTATVYIGGQWVDADNNNFFVKPSTGTVITNLKAFGPVQFVNTGGSSYNQNIRLPRASDGISMISMATNISTSSGNILGQWNLVVLPTTGGVNQGQFSIFNGTTASFSIATATSTATFAANVFAPKYLQLNGNQFYFLQPAQTSYLNELNVGVQNASWPVLTTGPLDSYVNTYTYVHTALKDPISAGGAFDVAKTFNSTALSYMSYVGTLYANSFTPANVGTDWYGLYQAQHRGGYTSGSAPNGQDYSSQIVIPVASSSAANLSRMFFRAKKNTAWQTWNEVFTVGATNQAQGYEIYSKTLYDYSDTRFNITPAGTSILLNLKTYGSITGYISGLPTAAASGSGATAVPALPRLGSAEWVYPGAAYADIGISTGTVGFNRTRYREGLYTWKTGADVTVGKTPSTIGKDLAAINPYFAAVGFGDSTGGVEIAGYLLSGGAATNQGQGLYFRTLRDNTTSPWSRWTEVLNTATHSFATVLNQNLRTTDSPTFNSITLSTAPTFGQVIAKSYWITGGANNKGKIVIPWNGNIPTGQPNAGLGGAGAIGPYYANATTDLNSFRFDEVSPTVGAVATGGEQGYLGNDTNISIYIGTKKIIGESGKIAYHDTISSLSDTNYKLIPNGISQISALEVKNGITFTGDNLTAGQSAKLNLTAGRGLVDAKYSTSSNVTTAVGTVATFGPGLNSYDGYVIGGTKTAGVYDASFIKSSTGPEWGIRGGGGNQWAIYANGGDASTVAKTQRMSLNNDKAGLVNSAYGLSILGTVYASQNIYAFSDKRKKTDISTIDNALGKVLQLRGVYYYRTDPEPEDVGRREVGVIAQEVLEILPEAVKHSNHTDEYSVNYGNMAGIFIEAIKDLKKELDELKAELNMLKGNK